MIGARDIPVLAVAFLVALVLSEVALRVLRWLWGGA